MEIIEIVDNSGNLAKDAFIDNKITKDFLYHFTRPSFKNKETMKYIDTFPFNNPLQGSLQDQELYKY